MTVALTAPVSLRRPTLGRLQVAAIALAALALTAVLFAVTPMQGVLDYILVAYLIFLAAQTAVSYGVEGARSARNRLGLTLLVSAVLLALTPLVAPVRTMVMPSPEIRRATATWQALFPASLLSTASR